MLNEYRDDFCGNIDESFLNKNITLSGWVHNKRNHGGVLFIDLRDQKGIVQVVINETNKNNIDSLSKIPNESVITIKGIVKKREETLINNKIKTGSIEIHLDSFNIISESLPLPFQINTDDHINEDLQLQYRFLDLRRSKTKERILKRIEIISYIRNYMKNEGFFEIQTPILTASSPEGARDFLVPSRIHKGKFYALPQAPQQFKQILMAAGFDKYFQIAPCFRDEDTRADRSPTDFYQLDMEMSFVNQNNVLNFCEKLILDIFEKFKPKNYQVDKKIPKIKYIDSMNMYGTDKPDLRNPIINQEVTDCFENSNFSIFVNNIKKGAKVFAIPAPQTSDKPRSFFDGMIDFAIQNEAKGLAYIIYENENFKSPIAKFLKESDIMEIKERCNLKDGDSVFFSCDFESKIYKISSLVRNQIGKTLNLINESIFKFCIITDYPIYEINDNGDLDFSHNPFSMPQGGIDAIKNKNSEELLKVLGYQYDFVCNGYEISSGAIRNHDLECFYKVFENVGYSKEKVNEKFSPIVKAFSYGVPPHGGMAPGIERIVMLLCECIKVKDVITFPMNGKAEDTFMACPSEVSEKQLKELGIKIDKESKKNH